MPEATPAGGGYSCQVCGSTYSTESELIQHGRDRHPDRPVTWGDPRETTLRAESTMTETKSDMKQGMEDMGDKMKAGAKAVGEKVAHPEKDLKTEYEQKKTEERAQ